MARRRPGLRRDEGGQMMLLTGFIFVVGLLAMTATLARIPIIAKQVNLEQDRPLVQHLAPLLEGVDAGLAKLATLEGLQAGTAAYDAAVAAYLEHLRAVEAAQGYLLEWSLACDSPGDPATARAHLDIGDGVLRVQVRTARITLSACP